MKSHEPGSASWRKSSYSGINGGCVEVALAGPALLRDSKDAHGDVLRFSVARCRRFLDSVR